MKSFNSIIVINSLGDKLLMCKRSKEPYIGLYNFVGGKREEGETAIQGAYRELFEETGISPDNIALLHLMDFVYPIDDCEVTVFAGRLRGEVTLVEEAHNLYWIDVDGHNFFDMSRFGGEGDIGHMMEHVKLHRGKIDAMTRT